MEFDTGALSAFQGGLSQGSHIASANREHQLALQRLLLAQQAEQNQQQYQQSQLQQGQQRIDQQGQYNAARLGMTAQAAQQKQTQFKADQQGNADIYTRNELAPQAVSQMMADPSDTGLSGALEGLQSAQSAFGQMSPQAQAPTMQDMWKRKGQQNAADVKMQIAEYVQKKQLEKLHSWALENKAPPQLVAREEANILGGFDPGPLLTPKMYKNSPAFGAIPPEHQAAAIEYVDQNGHAPPKEFFAPKDPAGKTPSPNNDPTIRAAASGIKMAEGQWKTTYAQSQAAEHALNAYMKTYDEILKAATAKGATPEQKQIAEGLLALRAKAHAAETALNTAQQNLIAAHKGKIEAEHGFGQRQQGMTHEDALQQVYAKFPNLDPANPEDAAKIKAEYARIRGSTAGHSSAQPTGTDNSRQQFAPDDSPYSDQRAEPDDTEPDMDEDDQ